MEVIMKAITYDFAGKNFEKVFNMPDIHNVGIEIVKEDKSFVLLDKDILDSLLETVDIAKDRDFVSSLKEAEAQMERGESYSFEDVFGEKV
jgi:PHD/YefM family antitoxin component YafN of YafNO toxin-antitoxin module